MNSVKLACLMGLLAGCAGASLRGPRPLSGTGDNVASARRSVLPGFAEPLRPLCEELALYVDLGRFAEFPLGEVGGYGDHTTLVGDGPAMTAGDRTQPGWLLHGWLQPSGLCATMGPGGPGFLVLPMPELSTLWRPLQRAPNGLLPSPALPPAEIRFLVPVDPARLARDVLGAGSPLADRTGPLRLGLALRTQSPLSRPVRKARTPRLILLPGHDNGPTYERPFGATLLEDELESRFRLPSDAGPVLIWRF